MSEGDISDIIEDRVTDHQVEAVPKQIQEIVIVRSKTIERAKAESGQERALECVSR